MERKSELCSKGQIRPLTRRSFEGMALRISHSFAQNNIHEVSVKNIIKWVDGIRGGARTKRNYLNSLSEILNFAVLNDYIESNPLDKLTNSERRSLCGTGSEKGIAILKINEAKKLLQTAKDNRYLGLLDAIVLCLFCGIRTEEIKKLKWENISIEKRVITISSEIAKKRSIRYVDIPINALTWLNPLKRGSIVNIDYNSHYNNRLSKLIKASGVKWKTNIMRHSFGSYHYGLYNDSLSTSQQLGHKTGDNILFSHYRNLVSYEDSKAYFEITDVNN
ncbi:MAG: site-specific integrase [Opitutales bacterium TMED207]|nr:MAG: site-specific integrase [Opitutales bacterium TMED207]